MKTERRLGFEPKDRELEKPATTSRAASRPPAAGDGMTQHPVLVVEPQQRMHEAAVPHVDLRRLDEAFADVGVEGRQAAHEEQVGQQVDVSGHGLAVDGQRARQRGHVQQAPLTVREHRPEPPQRPGRHPRPQLRHVPLQIRPNELLAPLGALPVVLGQKARWESASNPQLRSEIAAGLPDVEWRKLEIGDASRQTLAGLPQQIRGGRTEQQELSGNLAAPDPFVDEHPQQLEQSGRALHLVDDHEPAGERAQVPGRVAQLREVGGVLQIEVHALGVAGQPPRQRRLADLPGPEQGDGGKLAEAGGDGRPEGSGNHLAILDTMSVIARLSWGPRAPLHE